MGKFGSWKQQQGCHIEVHDSSPFILWNCGADQHAGRYREMHMQRTFSVPHETARNLDPRFKLHLSYMAPPTSLMGT
jgi:hypothetical protein